MANVIGYKEFVYTGVANIYKSLTSVDNIFKTEANLGFFCPTSVIYTVVGRGSGGTGSSSPIVRIHYVGSTATTLHTATTLSSSTAGFTWIFASDITEVPASQAFSIRNGASTDSYDFWNVKWTVIGYYLR